jgi:hypothetical protein
MVEALQFLLVNDTGQRYSAIRRSAVLEKKNYFLALEGSATGSSASMKM